MNVWKSLFILFATVILAVVCASCRSTGRIGAGSFSSGTDYLEPVSIDGAQHAIRERVYYLERELEQARNANRIFAEQLTRARETVGEINQSGQAIRELSRRSALSIHEVIGQMEALSLWINWATGRIQYLENLLDEEIQNPDMVE